MTTLVQSLYQTIILEMLDFQNEYFVPLLFVGMVMITAVFIYHQRNNGNKRTVTKTLTNHDQPVMTTSSSSSSLTTTYLRSSNHFKSPCVPSPSASFVSSSPSAANQLYRKDDYDTRYDSDGTRYQCVSVPFRLTQDNKAEVLMITSRGKGDYIFPGGGWETTESAADAAEREAFEEAGIRGTVVKELVTDQHYTSDKGNKSRLWGFLMTVNKLEEEWPESERRRKWMSIDEAERALSKKRRIKFGALWSKTCAHFIEQNLYHPPSASEKQSSHKNGYQISHSYLNQISSRSNDEKNSQESRI